MEEQRFSRVEVMEMVSAVIKGMPSRDYFMVMGAVGYAMKGDADIVETDPPKKAEDTGNPSHTWTTSIGGYKEDPYSQRE